VSFDHLNLQNVTIYGRRYNKRDWNKFGRKTARTPAIVLIYRSNQFEYQKLFLELFESFSPKAEPKTNSCKR